MLPGLSSVTLIRSIWGVRAFLVTRSPCGGEQVGVPYNMFKKEVDLSLLNQSPWLRPRGIRDEMCGILTTSLQQLHDPQPAYQDQVINGNQVINFVAHGKDLNVESTL